MKCLLYVAVLTIQSSYAQNVERPVVAASVPDTVQWWISPKESWRIKTFAIDHDIHTYQIGGEAAKNLEIARSSTLKSYGDVLSKQYEFTFENCLAGSKVRAEIKKAGLEPNLEIAPNGFWFLKPDDADYRTISTPAP
jgi:hypothetical protein